MEAEDVWKGRSESPETDVLTRDAAAFNEG